MTLEAQRTSASIAAPMLAAIEDRIAAGDRAAFAEWYDLVAPRVHRDLVAAVGRPRAVDLATGLLVDAWERAPRLHARGASLAAWALGQVAVLVAVADPPLDLPGI